MSTAGIRPIRIGFTPAVLSEKTQYIDGRHNAKGTACGVITITSTPKKRKTPVYIHRVFGPLFKRGIILIVYGIRQKCHDPGTLYLKRQLFLMTRACAGYPSRQDFPALCNKVPQNVRRLVVNGSLLVFTKSACLSLIICPPSRV